MRLRRSLNIRKERYEVWSITDPAYKGKVFVIGSKGAINHLRKQLKK